MMHPTRFFTTIGLLALGLLSALGARPNVLFIAIDDLVPTMGCYGDPHAITPHMDSLAAEGTLFLNSYTPFPVCGPARAAMTTSLTPEETGVIGFKPIRAILPDVVTLPQHFRNNGYETACTGKFHDPRTVGVITDPNGQTSGGANTDDVPSWSIPYVKAAAGFKPAGKPATDDTDQSDTVYGDYHILEEGLSLLTNTLAAGDKPFFLAVGFKKPHLPFVAPKQYWDLYTNTFPLAPFTDEPAGASSYTTNMLADNDELLGYEPFITNGLPIAAQQRVLIHGYYACASFVDGLVGQLRAALAATNDPLSPGKKLAETTIVVLWGDHGFHLGDHGRWAKHSNMERAAFCPLIIFDPQQSGGGTHSTAPVNAMDIYPTLCELAGLPIPEQPLNASQTTGRPLRGRSLVPLLNDPGASVHAGVVTLFSINGGYGYAYRTERFRYIEWVNKFSVVTARELYDYVADPLETMNLATHPAYATIVYQLSRSMRVETPTLGTTRLQNSDPIPASGAGIELGEGLLPDVEIALTDASVVTLRWPWSNGVTYDVTQKPSLQAASWGTASPNLVGGSADMPINSGQGYYQVKLGSNTPPVFTSDPMVKPNAITNSAYAESLASNATDDDAGASLSFSKLDGPAWLVVATNGLLSGLPSVSDMGSGYYTVQVADDHGATAQARLQITVTEPPPPPPLSFTITNNAIDDTFAKQANPTLDAGVRSTLELRQEGASSFSRIAYLKFTVTGVSNVIGAKLYLHSNTETDVVNAHQVADTTWSESSLNWSNRPALGPLIGSATPSANSWFSIDVGDTITGDGTYAIGLDEQGNSLGALDSKEGGFPPRLEIESAVE